MTKHRYSTPETEAVYRAIHEQRDMRYFLPDSVSPQALTRLTRAAHDAPSVSSMQPWRFVCVIDAAMSDALGSGPSVCRSTT